MKINEFVRYWQKSGFNIHVRTVGNTLTWCFTCSRYTFFIPSSAIVAVGDAIAKYGNV